MKKLRTIKVLETICFLVVLVLSFVQVTFASSYKVRFIRFDDIRPRGSNLTVCWGGIGIDHNQNVYFAASDQREDHPDDTVLFRYNTQTGARKLLGTLRGISAAEGNLNPEENIGKVHVSIQEHKGKMYFSSHDYHDIKSDYSDMYERRGGHFYTFDLKTEEFEDLSKTDNYGVSVPYQGIIAMDILRKQDKLVGFTFPMGDFLIYDLKKRKTTFYPGVPEYRMWNVSREIWATKKGKVYFSYYADDFWLWEFEVKTGAIKRTEKRNILRQGSLHGKVATRDGNTIYLLGLYGNLYAFDVGEEHLEDLGSLLPPEEIAQGGSVTFAHSLILSHDEKALYTLPRSILYKYDIETGQKTRLADFSSVLKGTVTGSGVIDDQGRMYFGYHSGGDEGQDARLIQ
ncbi:MAG: hypothetical protein ABIH23_04295, partial [bacterium]